MRVQGVGSSPPWTHCTCSNSHAHVSYRPPPPPPGFMFYVLSCRVYDLGFGGWGLALRVGFRVEFVGFRVECYGVCGVGRKRVALQMAGLGVRPARTQRECPRAAPRWPRLRRRQTASRPRATLISIQLSTIFIKFVNNVDLISRKLSIICT